MHRSLLILTGQSTEVQGQHWESDRRLTIGRQVGHVDVLLQDSSVSPYHAEVVLTRQGWAVRDMGSMNGTSHNGKLLTGQQQLLSGNDEIAFGRLTFKVQIQEEEVFVPSREETLVVPLKPAPILPSKSHSIRTTSSMMRVQAAMQQSWEQAISAVAASSEQHSRLEKHFRALLRASYSVCHVGTIEELLQAVLDEAVQVLDAQRGAMLMADEDRSDYLRLRALRLSRLTMRNRGTHSHTLAQRCYEKGESLLCADARVEADVLKANSVAHGAMTSVVCALLRTPRQKLGVLHLDRGPLQPPFSKEEFYLADALAATVSVGIESTQLVEKQRQQFVQTVTALGRVVEIRDYYTASHTSRVTDYALMLAKELQVSPAELSHLEIGTPLHDIGKIGIEDAILRKPGRLTNDEFERMKLHTVQGAAILETVPSLQPVIPIARHHHERWDGQGYPDKLVGESISLVARIVAVADAFDAMTSDRPYRVALPLEAAFAELRDQAGSHFDPACVRAFLDARKLAEVIYHRKELVAGETVVLPEILPSV